MKRLMLAAFVIPAFCLGVLGFAAFESHIVNVQAHVVSPLSQTVNCEATGPDGPVPCPSNPGVPTGVPVKWTFQINITNPLDVPLMEVAVSEEFAAQVDLSVKGPHPGTVATSWPHYPDGGPLLQWYGLTLAPGGSYTLTFDVELLDGQFAEPIPDLILATGALMTGRISGGSEFTATTASVHIEVVDPPDGLEINTDIDFGIVFPQQTRTDYFKVCLSKTWCECGGCGGCGSGCGGGCRSGCSSQSKTDYKVVLNLKPLPCSRCSHETKYYPDLRPYLIVQRDPSETGEPAEPDGIANGIGGDFIARGHLDAFKGDKCDKWLVTMRVPVFAENYNPETDPIPPEQVLILPPEADPNGWDLGADIKIELDGTSWWSWMWDWWWGWGH
jgi:hypothetical protein